MTRLLFISVLLHWVAAFSAIKAQIAYLAREIVPAGQVANLVSACINSNGLAALVYATPPPWVNPLLPEYSIQLWLPQAQGGLPAGSREIKREQFGPLVRMTPSGQVLFRGASYFWNGTAIQTAPLPAGMEGVGITGINDSGLQVGHAGREPREVPAGNSSRFENPWEYQRPILFENSVVNDLSTVFPLPPSDRDRLYIPRGLNEHGDITGWATDYVKRYNIQGAHTGWLPSRVRTFLTRNGFTIIPAADDTNNAYLPYDLNDKGQILIERVGIRTNSQLYLYLPVADYGFQQAGLRGPIAEHSVTLPRLNNQGQIAGFSWGLGDGGIAPEIWNRGTWMDVRTLTLVNPGFSPLRALDINDRGQILCAGTVLGKDGERLLLLTISPALIVAFVFPANRLALDDEFEFTVRVTNGRLEPLREVQIVNLQKSTGTGHLEPLSGPTPGAPADLDFQKFVEHRYRYRATTNGTFSFAVDVQALRTNGVAITNRTLSSQLIISIPGDLLIKRAVEANSQFGLEDIYQSIASRQQIRTNSVRLNEAAEFQVKIQNDGSRPATYRLAAIESGPAGWSTKYFFDNQDISTLLQTFPGAEFPELEADEEHIVTVRVTPTTAPFGSTMRSTLALSSPRQPTRTLDVVEAVTELPLAFLDNPAEVVSGETFQVTLEFTNPTTEPMSEVKATIEMAPGSPDVLIDLGVEPAMVASLAPGQSIIFTNLFIGGEMATAFAGDIHFVGEITARLPGSQPFSSGLIRNRATKIGRVSILKIEPVQALYNVAIVAGKPMAARVTLTNTFSTPRAVELSLSYGGEVFNEVIPSVPPGASTNVLPGAHWFIPTRSAQLECEVLRLDAVQLIASQFVGQRLGQPVRVRATRALRIRWMPMFFAAKYGLPSANWDRAKNLAEAMQPYINAAFPMPPQNNVVVNEMNIDWPPEYQIDLLELMWTLQPLFLQDGYDRTIMILPLHPQVWPPGPGGATAKGLTHEELKQPSVNDEVEGSNLSQIHIAAHELGHTFGFRDDPNPVNLKVRDGHWVERHMPIKEAYDVMDYFPAFHWITRTHYNLLVEALSRPRLDPEVVVVGGSVAQDGRVRTGAWSTILTDQVSENDPLGTHLVRMLGTNGEELGQLRFTPDFNLVAASDEFVGAFPVEWAPFVFTIVKPAGLKRVQIMGDNRVLFERIVSAHGPVIQSLEILQTGPYQAGQSVPVRWAATDADGDALTAWLHFSDDDGRSWNLANGFSRESLFAWKVGDLPTRLGRLRLSVTDGIHTATQVTELFQVTGTTARIIASAGPDQTVFVGERAILDARGSHDSGGSFVDSEWKILGQPDGSNVVLADAGMPRPSFTPSHPGLHVIQLTVRDGRGAAGTAYVNVTVLPSAGVRLAISLLENSQIRLAWPATATKYALEFTDTLSPAGVWQPVIGSPTLLDNQNMVTNTVAGQTRYYRLRPE